MVGAVVVFFGLSLAEVVILAGFAAYILSIVRDWRPMRSLREENRDLRAALALAEKNLADYKADSEKQIADLRDAIDRLKRATDLSPIAKQQLKGIELLESLVAEVRALDGSVRANTAAVETLSKRRIIDEALHEEGERE